MPFINGNSGNTFDNYKIKKEVDIYSKPSMHISLKNINYDGDKTTQALGFKFENESFRKQLQVGNIPVKASLEFLNNATLSFGPNVSMAEASLATGTLKYSLNETNTLFLSSDLIGNVSHFNVGTKDEPKGITSAGAGGRISVGVELDNFRISAFKEIYTNSSSFGITIGAKIY